MRLLREHFDLHIFHSENHSSGSFCLKMLSCTAQIVWQNSAQKQMVIWNKFLTSFFLRLMRAHHCPLNADKCKTCAQFKKTAHRTTSRECSERIPNFWYRWYGNWKTKLANWFSWAINNFDTIIQQFQTIFWHNCRSYYEIYGNIYCLEYESLNINHEIHDLYKGNSNAVRMYSHCLWLCSRLHCVRKALHFMLPQQTENSTETECASSMQIVLRIATPVRLFVFEVKCRKH